MDRRFLALLVILVVLAASTAYLFYVYRHVSKLHETASAMLRRDALYSSSCLAGDLYNIRNLAGRNETLMVYQLLYNARDCAQILGNYYNYLYHATNDPSYQQAATRLEVLATWLQNAGQRLIAYNGSQAPITLHFLNQSQELVNLREAIKQAQLQMIKDKEGNPPSPEKAAEIARAIDELFDATPWIAGPAGP